MKIPLLLSALAFTAVLALFGQNGPALPDGKGKDLVTDLCADCHGLDKVTGYAGTQDWGVVVYSMRTRGLVLTQEETAQIVAYLATNFPPGGAKGKGNGKAPEPAKPAPTQPK